MMIVPFSLLPPKAIIALSRFVRGPARTIHGLFPYLQMELDRADLEVKADVYVARCIAATLSLFLFLALFLTFLLLEKAQPFFGAPIAFLAALFVFFMQLQYPKVVARRRIKKLDVDLLASLNTMLIHLNSGVPLFETLVIISKQEFGEVSKEFGKAVKQIHTGVPQIESLERMTFKNPSPYFRRAIWQLISGMKSGASINEVIEDVVKNLTKEQVIQIERYGSQLNPFAMFYMMFAVILPALSVTFLSVIVSFVGVTEALVKLIYWSLFAFVMFVQLMFFGVIKAKRPSLLGD